MYEEVVIDRNMKVNFKPGQVRDKDDFSVSDIGGSGGNKKSNSPSHFLLCGYIDIQS